MNRFRIEYDWLKKILPEGMAVPSSTLISGPGGSGKPLIGAMLLASWLKQEGSIIQLLINSGRSYNEKMLALYGIHADDYKGKIIYVDFDYSLEAIQEVGEDEFKANLLKADVWQTAIKKARGMLPQSERPALVFGSALNILLFSPTYSAALFQVVLKMVRDHEHCLFTVSNNVFEDKMGQLEAAADNLMFTHSEKIMELHLNISRMKGVPFSEEDIRVPLTEDELRKMRSEAERMRQDLIPAIRKI